jgi:hypothetical protein
MPAQDVCEVKEVQTVGAKVRSKDLVETPRVVPLHHHLSHLDYVKAYQNSIVGVVS